MIVASGPSAGGVPIEMARGRAKVIAINNSWELAPWADILFACDAKWWDRHQGCPDFEGLKLCIEKPACKRWGVGHVTCMKPDDRFFHEPKGTVGWGGNSGFHCLNLGVQFGVKRILLVGYDMHIKNGLHWHGSHLSGLNNPTAGNAERWRKSLDAAHKEIAKTGVEVLNCSPISALQKYPKAVFEDVI
ncbi:hypothetical protein [Roseovarius indicus]|uniref:Norphogenetic protein n=1 Tax=Roseovarius indicus TaxID=540747 RepID=A0A0T5P876_9RHOB|nr:hypothetical protein [Roseovarius indicus]KRS17529.1 hypothetical protein XM52_13705 [Roseovarius indicus]